MNDETVLQAGTKSVGVMQKYDPWRYGIVAVVEEQLNKKEA